MLLRPLLIALCLVILGPQDPPASKPKKASTTKSFGLPGKPWSLTVDLKGFKITGNELSPDGAHRKIEGENRKAGFVLSIFLEPAEKDGDSKVCRKTYGRRLYGDSPESLKEAKVKTWELGDLAAAEYQVGGDADLEGFCQHHLNGYMVHDSVWIDIHLSKVNPSENDLETMRSILKSAKIGKPTITPARELFFRASAIYRAGDYKKAAGLYQQALDMEKEKRTFDKLMWRILVDQLGMAYGISGDLDKSEEVLKYGIKEDPEYPLFYYNLACTYAEKGELKKAMSNLEKAFKRKKNLNPKEEMPDPREDSSFKNCRDTKEFKETLRKIGL